VMLDPRFRSKAKFRPSSAPAGRPKSASTARSAQDSEEKSKRSAASISIAYLRAAAEKKKARDREFAVRIEPVESGDCISLFTCHLASESSFAKRTSSRRRYRSRSSRQTR
jgi:hypothetical protein